jgi:hypothetical protein
VRSHRMGSNRCSAPGGPRFPLPTAATRCPERKSRKAGGELRPIQFGRGAAEVLAAATGTSKRSAEREIRLARTFSAKQIEALDRMGVAQTGREAIAKIKAKEARESAVNLIAKGMAVPVFRRRLRSDGLLAPVGPVLGWQGEPSLPSGTRSNKGSIAFGPQ